jgi:hypothetical protein
MTACGRVPRCARTVVGSLHRCVLHGRPRPELLHGGLCHWRRRAGGRGAPELRHERHREKLLALVVHHRLLLLCAHRSLGAPGPRERRAPRIRAAATAQRCSTCFRESSHAFPGPRHVPAARARPTHVLSRPHTQLLDSMRPTHHALPTVRRCHSPSRAATRKGSTTFATRQQTQRPPMTKIPAWRVSRAQPHHAP